MTVQLRQEFLLALQNSDIDHASAILRSPDGAGFRAIVSTAADGAMKLGVLTKEMQREAPCIVPLLAGPHFFFVSRELVAQADEGGGHSEPEVDWSVGFDSNVGEDIRAFLCGKSRDPQRLDRVVPLLEAMHRYGLQTDIVPFLQENVRFTRADRKNRRPHKTAAAFRAIDYLDWRAFQANPEDPKILRSWFRLDWNTRRIHNTFMKSPQIRVIEARARFAYALLLQLAILWIPKRARSAPELINRLVEFSVRDLGKFAAFELRLALEFLIDPMSLAFFDPLRGVAKDLPKELRGMAWDLTHVRSLETLATLYRKKRFFIPFFATFDDKFAKLIETRPVEIITMDSVSRSVTSYRRGDREFQQLLGELLPEETLGLLSVDRVEARRQSPIDADKLEAFVADREAALSEIVGARG